MKKASSRSVDDLRPEYDFSSLKGGVRGKYARRFRAATNLVLLEPDRFVEVQGTGEAGTFDRPELDRLLDLAHDGVRELFRLQRQALGW